MKFTDKQYTDTLYIYASGTGKNAEVCIRFPQYYDSGFCYNFDLEEAKIFSQYLNNAIYSAEERSKIIEDE